MITMVSCGLIILVLSTESSIFSSLSQQIKNFGWFLDNLIFIIKQRINVIFVKRIEVPNLTWDSTCHRKLKIRNFVVRPSPRGSVWKLKFATVFLTFLKSFFWKIWAQFIWTISIFFLFEGENFHEETSIPRKLQCYLGCL